MPDRMDYANEFARQVDKEMKGDLMAKPKINDIGVESYNLYVHYKKEDHVLLIGAFSAMGWIEALVKDYLPEHLTFTMVEI